MLWESTPVPKPTPRPRRTKKASSVSPEIARAVGEEILTGTLNPAEWANALAKTGTNDGTAVAEYAKQRIDNLHRERVRLEQRALEMEMRKRHFCGAAPVNIRRPKLHHEKPSFIGIILTFIGLWSFSAAIINLTKPGSSVALIPQAAIAALTVAAFISGIYFLAGKPFRRIFSGDRILGIGAMLCGLSLALALRGTFRQDAPESISQQAIPAHRPLQDALIVPQKESPRVSFR